MQIIKTLEEMQQLVGQWHDEGYSVGLVPTMGFLHEGHLSLIRESVNDNDKTVISIFVNPIQFGSSEDLDEYPRDLEGDTKACGENGVDAIFAPSVSEMYPNGFSSLVEVGKVSEVIAGENRPGHFRGVCTVVNKLFNITSADHAYFGQKDAQQLAVIRKMVKDLNMNIAVVGCPTVREDDGLAMSSRNSYLSADDRKKAPLIYKALCKGNDAFRGGEIDSARIKNIIFKYLGEEPGMTIDYLEIADSETMSSPDTVEEGDLCLISVKVGDTHLIDNIRFGATI